MDGTELIGDDAATGEGSDRDTGSTADAGSVAVLGRSAGRLAAWSIGVLLIVVGAFLIPAGPAVGMLLVIVGLFVTPRTRREIKELCRIWVGGD